YSPTCPHCQDVINNHWPAIRDEFGDQLQVLFINVMTPEGTQMMHTAREAMHITSSSVPMLIIGTDVLVGSVDIPLRAPDLIRSKLSSGGIGYPPIPGIAAVFQSVIPETTSSSTPIEIKQRPLLADPANLAALIVLLGLVTGIAVMGTIGWNLVTRPNRRLISTMNGLWGRRMAFVGTLVGIGLVGSLVLGSFQDPITLFISGSVLAFFVFLVFQLFRSSSMNQLSRWLMPLIIAAGLLVAGYLAYVEMTVVQATCGVMGDCNAVQQSSYAAILGVPVGIIGILGYLAILALWLVNQYKYQHQIDAALFTMALLGVVFSIYLTFLEPFVIGASCVWCLISAVVMGILLWITAPAGWNAIYIMRYSEEHRKKSV
ncbi:MAG: vitamin K epoxide reductase family protein, partial [Chloroflexota bacterium]